MGVMTMQELATQHGKPDMERLGIFIEMPYMHGKRVSAPYTGAGMLKGQNMMCKRHYAKNGTQDGYFDEEYKRIFEGEAITKKKKPKKKKKVPPKAPFMPAGFPKWHATPGDHYGTFGGIIDAFGTGRGKKKKYVRPKRNFLTNNVKKGGYGYAHKGLSRDLPYESDTKKKKKAFKIPNMGGPMLTSIYPRPFFQKNPFIEPKPGPVYVAPKELPTVIVGDGIWVPVGPSKDKGGCQAGMFEKYPVHKTDRDRKKEKQEKADAAKKRAELNETLFVPQSWGYKTMFTTSVMNHNHALSINLLNYKTFEPSYTKRLL